MESIWYHYGQRGTGGDQKGVQRGPKWGHMGCPNGLFGDDLRDLEIWGSLKPWFHVRHITNTSSVNGRARGDRPTRSPLWLVGRRSGRPLGMGSWGPHTEGYLPEEGYPGYPLYPSSREDGLMRPLLGDVGIGVVTIWGWDRGS